MKTNFLFIFLILSFLVAPSVFAINLTETDLYSEPLNLTINISNSLYATEVIVNDSLIYFSELKNSEDAVEHLTYFLNETDKTYSGLQIPRIWESSFSSKVINSSVAQNVSVQGVFYGDCRNVNTITITSPSGSSTLGYNQFSCMNGLIPLALNIQQGQTTISLSRTEQQTIDEGCSNIISGLGSGASWLAILVVVLFSSIVLLFITKQEDKFQTPEQFRAAIVGVVLVGVTLILGIFITESICAI